eukprot:4357296-Ditylum_brightwellii.AAC.1
MMKKEIFVLLDISSDKLPTVAVECDAGSFASDDIPVATVLSRRMKVAETFEEAKEQTTDEVQEEEQQEEEQQDDQVEAPTPQPTQGRGLPRRSTVNVTNMAVVAANTEAEQSRGGDNSTADMSGISDDDD